MIIILISFMVFILGHTTVDSKNTVKLMEIEDIVQDIEEPKITEKKNFSWRNILVIIFFLFLFALAGKVLLPYIYKRGDSGQNNSNQIPQALHQAKSRSRNQNQQIDTQQQIDPQHANFNQNQQYQQIDQSGSQNPQQINQSGSQDLQSRNQQIDPQNANFNQNQQYQQIDQSGSQNPQQTNQSGIQDLQQINQSRNQDRQSGNQQTNQNIKQQPNNLALKIFKGSSTVVMIFLILIYANTHVNPFGPRPEDMGIY